MDHCASVLLAFPSASEVINDEEYHKAARLHIQKVERLINDNGGNFPVFAQELVNIVDPAEHSISYLALLTTLLQQRDAASDPLLAQSADAVSGPILLQLVATFLLTFDARQIRYVGVVFSNLLALVEGGQMFSPSIAVELGTAALLRLDPTGSILTSHHLALVTLAYSSDNIEVVLPLIEKTIVFYPGVKSIESRYPCDMTLSPVVYITPDSGLTTKLTSTMVLKYDLLVAMCFIQQQSWPQAFEALERVVTYPVKDVGCSKIMVEAYNKWLLVGLLLTGRTPTLPGNTAQSVQKPYQTLGKPYISICKAFEGDSAEVLKAEYESLGNQFWAQDGNLGLIRLVVSHYQRWQIIDLHEVYTKISLEQIRWRTQNAETGGHLSSEAAVEALLQTMIDEKMLDGVIEKPLGEGKPAHLTFLTANDDLSEAEFAKRMKTVTKRIENLGPIVKATNERLAASQDYLRYLSREQKKDQANLSRNAGLSFDTVEDEDLMTGVVPGR